MNCPDLFVGNFLQLEKAEVDREDHKEHLPKFKLPKTIVLPPKSVINYRKYSQNNKFPAGNFCELDSDSQKTFRYLWRFYSLLCRGFFVAFPWLFRGPLPSRKTVFGPFSWLFRGFFVAFSWLFRFGQKVF